MRVQLMRSVLGDNSQIAQSNRQRWDEEGILALDFMGSPGSGKTSILERVVKELSARGISVKVIEGDVASANDAERIEAAGAEAFQINTGGGCHLHAGMVSRAMNEFDLAGVDAVFIENVGNLVCPTAFKLGAHFRVVVASVPEGDDKPEKYPVAFREADVIILNKSDLLPYIPFDAERFWNLSDQLNSTAPRFTVSCASGEGIGELCEFIVEQIAKVKG